MPAGMPTSVMPKGVEHLAANWRPSEVSSMPTSVMPKGVEHTAPDAASRIAELECPPL